MSPWRITYRTDAPRCFHAEIVRALLEHRNNLRVRQRGICRSDQRRDAGHDRTGERRWHVAIAAAVCAAGFVGTAFVKGLAPSVLLLSIAMMGLDGGRINIGACSLGGAQRCLDEAIGYTKGRKQFDQPIAEFQATQFTLADMETELQAARYLLYVAAAKVTANAPDKTKFAAMAKRQAIFAAAEP